MEQEFVETDLGKIQLFRGGSGDPLVYLHSATGEGQGLPFLDLLAEGNEVVAPMFPGFGESEGIDQVDDMEDAVFHLLDLFDRLGLDTPAVAGLSLGGWMAAELATRYPDRVRALVLVNPVGLYIEGAEIADIFGRTPGELAEDMFSDQSHPMAQMMHALGEYRSDPAQVANLSFDMLKPVVKTMGATARLGWDPYLHNPRLRRRLHRITCPTLVIRGEDDGLVPAEHAQRYVDEIAGARLEEISGAAHLIPLETPEELARLIGDHVRA